MTHREKAVGISERRLPDNEKVLSLVVCAKNFETRNVVALELKPEDGTNLLPFDPGGNTLAAEP